MFVMTVTMGLTAMLMAWIVFAIGLKEWAAARENKRGKKPSIRA